MLNCWSPWYGNGVFICGDEFGGGEEKGKKEGVFVAFGGGKRGREKGVGAVLWRLLLGLGMNIKVVE